MADSVKINKELLKRVNSIIKTSPNNIKYSSAKQFIDIAVLELLQTEESREKNREKGDKNE